MKRIIAGILTAAVMTFSACSSASITGKPDIDRTFSAKASVAAGGEVISGQLCRTADNCWTFTLNEPYALEGLTVSFCDGKTTFSMLGYECETDFSDSAVSAVKLFAEAYESAVDNKDRFENGVLEGSNENGAFTVTLDGNGDPAIISAGGFSLKLSELSEATDTEEQSDELILLE